MSTFTIIIVVIFLFIFLAINYFNYKKMNKGIGAITKSPTEFTKIIKVFQLFKNETLLPDKEKYFEKTRKMLFDYQNNYQQNPYTKEINEMESELVKFMDDQKIEKNYKE